MYHFNGLTSHDAPVVNHALLVDGRCSYKEELLKHIEAHNLPDCYGGSLSFSWWVVAGCTAAAVREHHHASAAKALQGAQPCRLIHRPPHQPPEDFYE
jgi:hypothetical protein